eukprot:13432785-Heterocapsa_arctica.AAC.1
MSDNGARYDRNAAIAVPEEDDDIGLLVHAIIPDVFGQPAAAGNGAPPGGQGAHAGDWDIWGSNLVDLKGVAKPP